MDGDIDVLLNIIPDLYSNKTKVLTHYALLLTLGLRFCLFLVL